MCMRKFLLPIVMVALALSLPAAAGAQALSKAAFQVKTARSGKEDTINGRDTIKVGEIIGKNNYTAAQSYLSPGNYILVEQGMQLKIVPSGRIEWPPPYHAATEKYSSQCSLGADGSLHGYVAGLPFPLLDPNDPQIAQKIIWNYVNRPMFTDDADLRYPEVSTYAPGRIYAIDHLTAGHMAFYKNVGRVEVSPMPTDPDAYATGIRSRFGLFPFVDPSAMVGYGLLRFRYLNPNKQDDVWMYNRESRRVRRETASWESDPLAASPAIGGGGGSKGVTPAPTAAFANNIDPDSFFGFSADPSEYVYRFLGERRMLASVHAAHSPEMVCRDEASKVCPENWEIRHLYVVEADAKPGMDLTIPRRILYIDSEGWFITASDQYDRSGRLWNTLVNFLAYSDRSEPGAQVAIYPFPRSFPVAMVDKNLQTGYTSVAFMPSPNSPHRDSWYVNMGAVDNSWFTTGSMGMARNM